MARGFDWGVPYTAERAREWIERSGCFTPLVAEIDGEIVGICTVTEHYLEKDDAYVDFLNVHPKHRGKGIGKALLLASIEETIKIRRKRLDLHTWVETYLRYLSTRRLVSFGSLELTSTCRTTYQPS